MKPDQTAHGGVHEDGTSLAQDAKEDAAIALVFAGPKEGEDRSDVTPVSGAAAEATSQRKIEANRRNALKSSGPRTASGKRRVSRNAVKHGIFSKHLLTNDVDGGEDPREYAHLYAAIHEHYRPVDLLEELLVDRIATLTWRLSRVPRCERGQIDRALSNYRFQAQQGTAAMLASSDMAGLHNAEEDSIVDDLLLPSNGDLDRLLKYEDAISKQRDRALMEIETLQAKRKAATAVNGDSTKQSH